jgi:transcription initiation factor TFIIH subunit 1
MMAPPPQGLTLYKKQEGVLAISKDRKSVLWTPASPPNASPVLIITADTMTNLQQTPETSTKVMLKIFAQARGQTEPVAHVFNFISSKDARSEANAIKDALTTAIQNAKAESSVAAAQGGGSSAAMTIANAISGPKTGNVWEDDNRLKSDVGLQESLMREDPSLRKTFLEAQKSKPESISNTQFTSQFWSSRVHLLRAHAITKGQSRASYNVLSSLKREEGGTKMSLTQEHVRLIFAQYPLMSRVYDEVVPKKYNEIEFWSKFFQSRLYTKLRGERINNESDPTDRVLDHYLDAPELTGLRQVTQAMHIPRIIDLEGNEEHHSQRQGNKPEMDLRPTALNKAPIIRTLNALSEKLMEHVIPSDVDPSKPIGMDEETYNNVRLRDLQNDPEQHRNILKIRDQSQFFSNERSGPDKVDDAGLSGINATVAIKKVCADVTKAFPHAVAASISFGLDQPTDEDASAEDDSARVAASTAMSHIMKLVRQHRAQTEEIPASSGLPKDVYEHLILTQATTTEFLRQFWSAFLSGDVSRVNEIASLVESLERAMDRIKDVAERAEADRNNIIRQTQKQADEILKRTGKKQRIDYKRIGGGAEVVKQLLGPITKAVANATTKYRKALQEQMAQQAEEG